MGAWNLYYFQYMIHPYAKNGWKEFGFGGGE